MWDAGGMDSLSDIKGRRWLGWDSDVVDSNEF
jgi:hypothetical protein